VATPSRDFRAAAAAFISTAGALLACPAPAQDVNLPKLQGEIERASQNVTSLGDELMGDKVNLYNGSLQFSQTDVSLPGNSPLPVQVTRTYATGISDIATTNGISRRSLLGDWDVDLPHMSGVFPADRGWVNGANTTARCSDYSAPPYVLITTTAPGPPPPDNAGGAQNDAQGRSADSTSGTLSGKRSSDAGPVPVYNYFYATEYWQGNFLRVPGYAPQEVLKRAAGNPSAPTDGNSYPLVTRDHWQLRCLSSLKYGAGEGFLAIAPDGTKYQFDWMATRSERFLKGAGTVVLGRVEARLYATLVTDRFGNTVSYAYDTSGRPLSITGSDGRKISFTYTTVNGLQRIYTVSDGTRTWTYAYTSAGDLATVTQPDSSQWKFNLRGLVYPRPYELGEDANCEYPGSWPTTSQIGTITHPSGAVGEFEMTYGGHSRSNVDKWCIIKTGRVGDPTFARWPHRLTSQTLVRKTISGPGISTPLTWRFSYANSAASWAPCSPCAGGDTKTVSVTDPRNAVTRHIFGIRFKETEGQLLSMQEGWNGTSALRQTDYSYRQPASQPYPEPPGNSISTTTDFLGTVHRPQDEKSVGVQGTTFSWTVGSFDARARPLTVTRSSTLGFSRGETTVYYDNTNKWALGQIASVKESSTGSVMESYSFDTVTLRPANVYRHGKLMHTNAFYANGLLLSRADGEGKKTTFASYMRGIPQLVTYHDANTESAVVNNIGLITSYTNEAKTTTGYGYDSMGRLSSITPPAGDPGGAFATTRSFVPVAAAEYGLPAGHWRQTITTGNAVTVNYFDAFWQPLLTRTYDSANEANTRRMTLRRFDPDGRQTFESYRYRSIDSIAYAANGHTTTYDTIGRLSTEVQDSELGDLTTRTEYLTGFQRRVTDPRNIPTVTSFQAFDTPSDEAPTLINRSGVTVGIARNVFGAPRSITRSGTYNGVSQSISRSYVYDTYQRLCKSIEGESGSTVQDYDLANNVSWRAVGLSLPSTTSCDTASAPAERKIVYDYDARNRLATTTYGDASPGITRTYTPDGLPLTIAVGGWKPSTWTLGYNNRRLLTGESLAINGATYNFSWGVNAYGKVSSLTYPDGLLVNYVPNALGEPTQMSGFASGITYHASGPAGAYTLANGIAVSRTLNTRQLPLKLTHTGIAVEQYGYDGNANLTAIDDQLPATNDRTLGYDNLERMTSASGPWGTGTFVYDAVDNLRTTTVGSRSTVASYVGNRLTSLSTNNVASSYTYDLNGNLTGKGSQGFTFDIGNRLASATGKATYAYDGLGRRTWIAYNSGGSKLQIYSQSGQLLYSQRGGEAAVRNVYLGDKLIAESWASGGTVFTHTDVLGSPIARTNASGVLLSRTTHEPYGATASGTEPIAIGFTGHVHDADTALVYMQQRYYDPIAGRFLSVDPVTTNAKTGEHFNRYAYANNSPYKYIDPDGQFANFAFGFAVGAGIESAVQMGMNNGSIVNPGAVIGAGVAGALTGGAAGVLSSAAARGAISAGTATAKTAVAGSAAAVVGKNVEGAVAGKTPSGGELAGAAVGGLVGGAAGGKIANAPIAAMEKNAAKAGVEGHVGETTLNAVQLGGKAVVPTSAGQELGKIGVDAGVSATSQAIDKKVSN
jgi:RHS repeat-associated protein